MKREKKFALGVGAFSIGIWAIAGFALGGLEGVKVAVLYVGLIACVAHTFGSVWRYFTLDE